MNNIEQMFSDEEEYSDGVRMIDADVAEIIYFVLDYIQSAGIKLVLMGDQVVFVRFDNETMQMGLLLGNS